MRCFFAFIIMFGVAFVQGAEIRVHTEPVRCSSTIVTLGEIAEIVPGAGENVDQFQDVALFPAPGVNETLKMSMTELRDKLSSRGIKAVEHRLTGPKELTLLGANDSGLERKVADRGKSVSPSSKKNLEAGIIDAIVFHLNRSVGQKNGEIAAEQWNVELLLKPEQTKTLAFSGRIMNVRGGEAPWIGRQKFLIEFEGIDPATNRRISVPIEAEVNLPPKVVVFKRAASRGKIISAADLELAPGKGILGTDFYGSVDDVIGMELSTNVQQGAAAHSRILRAPILVERNKPVSVVVRAQGVTVKIEGISLESGAAGDLVTIQRRDSKKQTFTAKVTGIGTVEVLATADASF